METVRAHIRTQEAVERLSVRRQEFMERFEALFAEKHLLDEDSYLSKKAEMEQKLDEFAKKYTDIRKKQNIVKKRMVYAYPELKNQFKKYRKKSLYGNIFREKKWFIRCHSISELRRSLL